MPMAERREIGRARIRRGERSRHRRSNCPGPDRLPARHPAGQVLRDELGAHLTVDVMDVFRMRRPSVLSRMFLT